MKVAYLSLHGIDDPKKSSCTPYFVAIALKTAFGEVVDISPKIEQYNNLQSWLRYDFFYIFIKLWQKFFNTKRSSITYRKRIQKAWTARIMQRLNEEKPDFIFADKCSVLFRYIKTDIPILYYSDATAELMIGYYEDFNRSPVHDIRRHIEGEKIALSKSDLFIPPSHWAANSAIRDYGMPENQVHVIRSHPTLAKEIDITQAKELTTKSIKFLFVGGDWVRKGGETAITVVRQLIENGYSAEITILCKTLPKQVAELDFVNAIEFLDRSTIDGENRYHSFFREANFFILPSIAEALGQVYVDALMHGLPSIAYNTGGVPEMVQHDHTGLLFETDVDVDTITKSIMVLIAQPERYRDMSTHAIVRYKEEFSYKRWARDLHGLVKSIKKDTYSSSSDGRSSPQLDTFTKPNDRLLRQEDLHGIGLNRKV